MAKSQKDEKALVRSKRFLTEVYAEGRKVTWPPMEQTSTWTVLVLVSTAFIALFLAIIDWASMILYALNILGG